MLSGVVSTLNTSTKALRLEDFVNVNYEDLDWLLCHCGFDTSILAPEYSRMIAGGIVGTGVKVEFLQFPRKEADGMRGVMFVSCSALYLPVILTCELSYMVSIGTYLSTIINLGD